MERGGGGEEENIVLNEESGDILSVNGFVLFD